MSAATTPLPPASRYALPASVTGGPVHLDETLHYQDGSVSFDYEVKDMADHRDGYAYIMVNAHNPSYASALTMARTVYSNMKPLVHGEPTMTHLPAAAYQGNPTVWGIKEVGDDGCRTTVVYAKHRVAVNVTVANYGLDTCDGGWVALRAQRIANALMTRIP